MGRRAEDSSDMWIREMWETLVYTGTELGLRIDCGFEPSPRKGVMIWRVSCYDLTSGDETRLLSRTVQEYPNAHTQSLAAFLYTLAARTLSAAERARTIEQARLSQ